MAQPGRGVGRLPGPFSLTAGCKTKQRMIKAPKSTRSQICITDIKERAASYLYGHMEQSTGHSLAIQADSDFTSHLRKVKDNRRSLQKRKNTDYREKRISLSSICLLSLIDTIMPGYLESSLLHDLTCKNKKKPGNLL